MQTLVTVIHVVAALLMVLVVLVQGGDQGGMGAAFGGGNTQGVFGASGATSFLGKLTYGAAAVFVITSLSLTALQNGGKTGLSEKLGATKTEEPATPDLPEQAAPAAATPAAEASTPAPAHTEAAPTTAPVVEQPAAPSEQPAVETQESTVPAPQ